MHADIERLRAELNEYKKSRVQAPAPEVDCIGGYPIVHWNRGKYDRRQAAARRAARIRCPLWKRVLRSLR